MGNDLRFHFVAETEEEKKELEEKVDLLMKSFEILPENIELSVYANHMDARIVEYTKREDYKPVFISPSSNCEDIKSVMHKDSEEEPIYLVVASQVATILVSLKNKTVYFIAYDNFELDEDIPLD